MKFVGQDDVYDSVGQKIKADLMDGNAVVLFAYGLGGSGKTYTVYGPDAADSPDAWFKHSEPHHQWGLFPRLAYDLFKEKQDGWKFSMKYFQNVVDIVRDLMSPMAEEKSYKTGMRKDNDGFMNIEWCQSRTLETWDDLREQFMKSNAKKVSSPTQFNHQSTRGHCILTLEVEMPINSKTGMKEKKRVYVCDLAGTEPAGDLYYADFQKTKYMEDGEEVIEHRLKGPHKDQRKTKELQDQQKKINLSLSEMAQFFMKMADAAKKKKLKPGQSIPGCNSYFLCKYLKDTMLQAKTYLFCAIRPEVKYHPYTFATLGFATNASAIKLAPKKATANITDNERKLMAEMKDLKALVADLQSGGGGGDDMAALLAAKQKELEAAMDGENGNMADEALNEALLAVEAATAALDNITKNDLNEVRHMVKPPNLLKLTCMMCTCMKPTGETLTEDWLGSKKMLGDAKLVEKLKNYPRDKITEEMAKGAEKYLKNKKLTAKNLRKVSKAGHGLYVWVDAILKYHNRKKEGATTSDDLKIANQQAEKLKTDDILQHQMAALSSGQLPFNRSRVMVVGQGRVGKTTLLRRLLGEPFNPNEQSTVGAVTQDIDAKVSNRYTTILFVLQRD
ncbi:hypothetical protein TrRE_jg11703 [Triparma retinervis]|uniref:Kinesin motor domain-containing protein n=1 Tax=Triparma retinervis TaxID=2557542 RepID=A0A9W7A5Z9_9STRA|nr:hypothetical protein TrRE_jg11703 [Triparma retinervis]